MLIDITLPPRPDIWKDVSCIYKIGTLITIQSSTRRTLFHTPSKRLRSGKNQASLHTLCQSIRETLCIHIGSGHRSLCRALLFRIPGWSLFPSFPRQALSTVPSQNPTKLDPTTTHIFIDAKGLPPHSIPKHSVDRCKTIAPPTGFEPVLSKESDIVR